MTKVTEVLNQAENQNASGFGVAPERTKPLGTEAYRQTFHGWFVTVALIAVLATSIYFLLDSRTPALAAITLSALAVIIVGGAVYALFGQKTTVHKLFDALTSWTTRKD